MPSTPNIVWFRRDLRLTDNPAWNAALRTRRPVIPLYIHAPREEGRWPRGAASRWWLHHALTDLRNQLAAIGTELVIRSGSDSLAILREIINQSGASHVFWNRCHDPAIIKRDTAARQHLTAAHVTVQSFNGSQLLAPHKLRNKSGNPFQVFTPFWKHCLTHNVPQPDTATETPLPHHTTGGSVDGLRLLPTHPWADGIAGFWNPTRQGAEELLEKATHKATPYPDTRDLPAADGTSRLSPYLHFGQISPREFFHTIRSGTTDVETADTGILRQLYWREFSAHLLYHFPHSQDTALKPEYDAFPWHFDETLIRAWQNGLTGFPIVDAGMRQLWHTGWMHNRVRMIAASLLVKHLLQPWQEGARWFWDTLVDADLPNNTMGWQWIAGSGADASPYFRIFNPIIQGKKFDPAGTYIKTWLPELQHVPPKHIHTPWEMPPSELQAAKVTLGKTYPHPVTTHPDGRKNALNAYAQFKELTKLTKNQ